MEVCLLTLFGKPALCVSLFVLIGIALIISGILIAVFFPFSLGRKIGISLLSFGVFLAVLMPLAGHYWEVSPIFQMSVYAGLTLVGVLIILSDAPKKK